MHAFRYNPVFKQWVMVGSFPIHPQITPDSFLDIGQGNGFVAAAYPQHPLALEPVATKKGSHPADPLFQDQTAVGEYELMLYQGKVAFADWKLRQWDDWLELLQHRLLQLHLNPYLHYLYIDLRTRLLTSTKPGQRVGDILAVSQPVAGERKLMKSELATQILEQESLFLLHTDGFGVLYLVSAPLEPLETWYIPLTHSPGIEQLNPQERGACAAALTRLYQGLSNLYPKAEWVFEVHTALAGSATDSTWWIRIYQEQTSKSLLPERLLPELTLAKLRSVL